MKLNFINKFFMNISMGLRKLINSIVNYKISINFKIHFIIVTNSELINEAK